MPRLGLRAAGGECEWLQVGETGDPPARRRKQQQQPRAGGRLRGKGGGGGVARKAQSGASNAIVLLPARSNHARVGGGGNSSPGPLFAGSGSSLLSSASAASGDQYCCFGSDHDAPRPQFSPKRRLLFLLNVASPSVYEEDVVYLLLPRIWSPLTSYERGGEMQHLAGRDRCSGPDTCRERRRPSFDTTTPHPSAEPGQDVVGVEEEEEEALDPAKHSFSIALKECQNRRFRSEVLASPAEGRHRRRRRPASLDLNGAQGNDAPFSSPGFFTAGPGMKKSSAVSVRSRSGTFPSPTTPNYHHGGGGAVGYHKGWSSERVPLPANASRRYGSTSALLPFTNGRALPSKWEDAEKWIFSPVSSEVGIGRLAGVPPHHRRPKSKSGPLGTAMGMGNSYSSASPPIPVFDRGRIKNFAESSPFLTGVLITDRGCCGSASSGRGGSGSEGVGVGGREVGGRNSYSAHGDEGIVRSASVHGCSDLLVQSLSLPSARDVKREGTKDAASMNSSVILRKDVATQMSPQDSTQSSPKEQPHFSPSTASSPTIEELRSHFSKLEVRDVQVDDRVTVTRWSKRHVAHGTDKSSANIVEWKKKTVQSRASTWEVAETAKCITKFKREEAKITAWENLQKAKAEAAIRKLEMKLEKKRSSSMDKILNKLKSGQRKAQEMRNAVTSSQANQVARTAKMSLSSHKAGHMSSLSGCFTCHAF